MRKTIMISLSMLLLSTAVSAQLIVDSIGNVGIATAKESVVPFLMVGDNSLFEGNSISIGVAATP